MSDDFAPLKPHREWVLLVNQVVDDQIKTIPYGPCTEAEARRYATIAGGMFPGAVVFISRMIWPKDFFTVAARIDDILNTANNFFGKKPS